MIDALPKLITVVDDDESVRESLFDLLEVYGYSVRTYSSAEEFLGSAAHNGYELPRPRHIDAGRGRACLV